MKIKYILYLFIILVGIITINALTYYSDQYIQTPFLNLTSGGIINNSPICTFATGCNTSSSSGNGTTYNQDLNTYNDVIFNSNNITTKIYFPDPLNASLVSRIGYTDIGGVHSFDLAYPLSNVLRLLANEDESTYGDGPSIQLFGCAYEQYPELRCQTYIDYGGLNLPSDTRKLTFRNMHDSGYDTVMEMNASSDVLIPNGILTVSGNITSNGYFVCTESGECLINYYNKSEVDSKINTTYYLPQELNLVDGVANSGYTVGNISYVNGGVLNITENTTTGITLYVNFTGVYENITMMQYYARYIQSGGQKNHYIQFEMQVCEDLTWESHGSPIADNTDYSGYNVAMFDSYKHVCNDGTIRIRFIHNVCNYNSGDYFLLDMVNAVKGLSITGQSGSRDPRYLFSDGTNSMHGNLTFYDNYGINTSFIIASQYADIGGMIFNDTTVSSVNRYYQGSNNDSMTWVSGERNNTGRFQLCGGYNAVVTNGACFNGYGINSSTQPGGFVLNTANNGNISINSGGLTGGGTVTLRTQSSRDDFTLTNSSATFLSNLIAPNLIYQINSTDDYIVVQNGSYTNISLNEAKLNLTIEQKIASKTYNATSYSCSKGTVAGNLSGTFQAGDNLYLNITEVSGVPGINCSFIFTNISESLTAYSFRQKYEASPSHSGHTILQYISYCDGSLEQYDGVISPETQFGYQTISIPDSGAHLCNNTVNFTVIHTQNGLSGGVFVIDSINFATGSLTTANDLSAYDTRDQIAIKYYNKTEVDAKISNISVNTSGLVPYNNATSNVNLDGYNLTTTKIVVNDIQGNIMVVNSSSGTVGIRTNTTYSTLDISGKVVGDSATVMRMNNPNVVSPLTMTIFNNGGANQFLWDINLGVPGDVNAKVDGTKPAARFFFDNGGSLAQFGFQGVRAGSTWGSYQSVFTALVDNNNNPIFAVGYPYATTDGTTAVLQVNGETHTVGNMAIGKTTLLTGMEFDVNGDGTATRLWEEGIYRVCTTNNLECGNFFNSTNQTITNLYATNIYATNLTVTNLTYENIFVNTTIFYQNVSEANVTILNFTNATGINLNITEITFSDGTTMTSEEKNVKQSIDKTSLSTTVFNTTDLSFNVLANKNYSLFCNIKFIGAAATTGQVYNVSSTAGTTYVDNQIRTASSATGFIFLNANTFNTALTGTGSSTTGGMTEIFATFTTNTTGVVSVNFRSEVAGSLSTLRKGSECELKTYP